jgi:hypothetical protein
MALPTPTDITSCCNPQTRRCPAAPRMGTAATRMRPGRAGDREGGGREAAPRPLRAGALLALLPSSPTGLRYGIAVYTPPPRRGASSISKVYCPPPTPPQGPQHPLHSRSTLPSTATSLYRPAGLADTNPPTPTPRKERLPPSESKPTTPTTTFRAHADRAGPPPREAKCRPSPAS